MKVKQYILVLFFVNELLKFKQIVNGMFPFGELGIFQFSTSGHNLRDIIGTRH